MARSSSSKRWILFAEAAEPAEQMGIAAQLGELEQLREIGLEIGEEVTSHAAIASRRAELQVGCESLDTGVKNLTEAKQAERQSELGLWGAPRLRREILGEDQPGLQRMTRRGQVVEQAAEKDEVDSARARGQGRILIAEAAEPAKASKPGRARIAPL